MYKMISRAALTYILAALLALSGCAYGKHIKQGDSFFERGEYERALASYEAAYKLDPDDPEASDKIRQTRTRLAEHYHAAAEGALAEDDLFAAIDAASKAYKFLPSSGRVDQLIHRISTRADEVGAAAAEQQSWAYTLALFEAVSEQLPPKRSAFAQKATQTRARWSEELQLGARDAEEHEQLGLAALYWAKSLQLSGDRTARQRLHAMRQQLAERHRYHAYLQGDADDAGYKVVASAITGANKANALHLSTRKTDADPKIDAFIHVGVTEPTFETRRSARGESLTYQSGTRMVKNPAYHRAQDDLIDEERRLVDYQKELSDAQYELDYYRTEYAKMDPASVSAYAEQDLTRAQKKVDSARDKVDAQREDVQHAREKLAVTDQLLEEAVYRDLRYTVTTHTRHATNSVQIRIEHADNRPKLEKVFRLELAASDDEHRAYPEAGLAGDPLTLPSDGQLRASLFSDAAAPVMQVIGDSFEGWRQKLVQKALQAPSDRERVDFYVSYVLTDPTAVAADVAQELTSMTGIPDAVEVLRP